MITLKLRHYGPGPHQSGSPQSVHGRGGKSKWESGEGAAHVQNEKRVAAFVKSVPGLSNDQLTEMLFSGNDRRMRAAAGKEIRKRAIAQKKADERQAKLDKKAERVAAGTTVAALGKTVAAVLKRIPDMTTDELFSYDLKKKWSRSKRVQQAIDDEIMRRDAEARKIMAERVRLISTDVEHSPAVRRALLTVELQLDKLTDHEEAAVIDDTGYVGIRRTGGQDYVNFTEGELRQWRGRILTHNHPNTGGSFSPEDIINSVRYGAAEMRAVGREKVFVMDFRQAKVTADDMAAWHAEEHLSVLSKNMDLIDRGQLSADTAAFMHASELWRRVVDNHPDAGLVYKEIDKAEYFGR